MAVSEKAHFPGWISISAEGHELVQVQVRNMLLGFTLHWKSWDFLGGQVKVVAVFCDMNMNGSADVNNNSNNSTS